MTPSDAFLTAFLALPIGTFTGTSARRRYVVTRQVFAQGKSHKLVAHELGGNDYISLNLYHAQNSGMLLRPCEMTARKVTEFVMALEPDS
ncbi:hypothetical protein [uncultured Ruegeria sp.]|uniref:hypothetical protein n=1 Tax=uncultured Ruegeria sp. TaxID=259304 RepID=UPI002612070C|nr:hypothetical protein [uncultured Ruegeria sp.]